MTGTIPMASLDSLMGGSVHLWLRKLHVAYLPGASTPLSAAVAQEVMRVLAAFGHDAQEHPTSDTDILLTTARFGEPGNWRSAPSFQARRDFGLRHTPTVWSVIQVRPADLAALQAHFVAALAKDPLDLADFTFPGLAPTAYKPLIEQVRRGGPILAIERVMQSQALALRLLAVVGEEQPEYAYHFDLVGGYARTDATSPGFYEDVVLRMATAISAEEVSEYAVVPPFLSHDAWAQLVTPAAMKRASLEFGRRDFFTDMVRIADLVSVPAVTDAVASQYSEGCFSTWDATIDSLVATTTGSARPVDKGHITDDDLAVVIGVRPDAHGVRVRHVEGRRNDPPSTEGFEMIDLDHALPRVDLGAAWGVNAQVPVVRSKLHGHRGVSTYDPRFVEYVPLAQMYYRYPVTCGTYAQAMGVKSVFARAQCLQNPDDPRQVAFTLLPTHGVFIVEKWVPGKEPFQVIWEQMDAGHIQIESIVPQGPEPYFPRQANGG